MLQLDLRPRRQTPLVVALTVGVGCLFGAGGASASETAATAWQTQPFSVARIFTFLFLMLGPFKIIGPFLAITKGAEAAFVRQIALRATLLASLGLLVAALIGESMLNKYGIPLPILALSAGIILFLVALKNTLQQLAQPASHSDAVTSPTPAPTLGMALSPLAFPTIVTPYGIAALVVFLAVSPDLPSRLTIGAVVLAIMLLNLVAMIAARRIGPVLGLLLAILGAVLGVIQVALGLQIINGSVKALGLL